MGVPTHPHTHTRAPSVSRKQILGMRVSTYRVKVRSLFHHSHVSYSLAGPAAPSPAAPPPAAPASPALLLLPGGMDAVSGTWIQYIALQSGPTKPLSVVAKLAQLYEVSAIWTAGKFR